MLWIMVIGLSGVQLGLLSLRKSDDGVAGRVWFWQIELGDTQACYQLIITITKFETEKGDNIPEKEKTIQF